MSECGPDCTCAAANARRRLDALAIVDAEIKETVAREAKRVIRRMMKEGRDKARRGWAGWRGRHK